MASSVGAVDRDVPGTPAAFPRRPGRAQLAWAALGAAAGAAVVLLTHRALIDDAYITLAYARNVATDLHWGLIPTEEANSATSPLNVLVLALVTWLVSLVTGDVRPVVGLGIVTVVLSALLGAWTAGTARRLDRSGAWSALALAVVVANPFVNSAIGLEVVLTAALLAGLTAQAVAGRPVAFGVLAGLLVLTRLDLGVIVAAVYLASSAVRRRFWVAPAVAVAVALPWFAFSWWHFGSAIPDTFVIKTLQRSFGEQTFANGLWTLWAARGLFPLALALVPAAVGLATAVALLVPAVRRRCPAGTGPLVGLVVGGLAYFGAYAVLEVPPYQWYYAPSTVALGLAGVLGLSLLLPRLGRRAGTALPVALALAVGFLFVGTWENRPAPWDRPVYFGAWALPADYRVVGAAVGEIVGDRAVSSPGEIGTLAYACRCPLVDPFSDRGITVQLVEQRLAGAGPLARTLLEWNFARLDRRIEPRPVEFRLVWTQGPVPPGVPSWPTNSPATGPGVLFLEPVS
jgi:hypothetical protein